MNAALARDLGVEVGDNITFNLQKVSLIPRETLLGNKNIDEVIDELRLTVKAVLPDQGMARFNLNPSTSAPRNAFVPLRLLQEKLKQQGRANAWWPGRQRVGGESAKSSDAEDGLVIYDPVLRTNQLFENSIATATVLTEREYSAR